MATLKKVAKHWHADLCVVLVLGAKPSCGRCSGAVCNRAFRVLLAATVLVAVVREPSPCVAMAFLKRAHSVSTVLEAASVS